MLYFYISLGVLSLITVIGFWWYLRKQQSTTATKVSSVGKKQTSATIWDVEDITKGVIKLKNNEYRMIYRLTAADFWLLSNEEQDAIENNVINTLKQLTHNFQVVVTSQAVDTRRIAEELRQQQGLNPFLGDLAKQRADYLTALMSEKAAFSKQSFVIIPFRGDKGLEHATGELQARLTNISGALKSARIDLEPLETTAIIDLFAHMLRKEKAFRPSEALDHDIMANYHVLTTKQKAGA